METYLKIIAVIFAVCMVTTGVALGFAGLGIQTASDRQAQTLEEWFGVELLTVTAADGTQIPVIRTEEGDYIDAASLIRVYYGESKYAVIYTVEDGRIIKEHTSVVTFSDGGKDPANLKNTLTSS
ncbi:hypothetical protein Mlab_0060 [Methanocorpusculum labreanum Z]|uniref:Uncharacterized protein n=1 Tax=Methanocorpusculum labreanum (strain ATCC 43576 / DSM 4855 / Z) TaxID=410358 RepID=A2SPI2_METLZ|nr:hypothetical protein [Methanocorpusculum labreanum]ABN06238.1 hypothetical protein Mlab_0060 [Methanocorpusculum labreanum Z]